jgi:hypothetical protein
MRSQSAGCSSTQPRIVWRSIARSARRAARCGETGSANAYGEGRGATELARASSSASVSPVPTPVSTGLSPDARWPLRASARRRATEACVLPTPVPVPTTARRVCMGCTIERLEAVPNVRTESPRGSFSQRAQDAQPSQVFHVKQLWSAANSRERPDRALDVLRAQTCRCRDPQASRIHGNCRRANRLNQHAALASEP